MQNNRVKNILKCVGIFLLLAGFTCTIIGFVDFFKAFSSNEIPSLIWCMFLGLPLMGLGSGFSMFAFRREIISSASENALDLLSTTLDNAQQNEKCKCGHENEPSALFCSACGQPLQKTCNSCGKLQSIENTYCNQCGNKL